MANVLEFPVKVSMGGSPPGTGHCIDDNIKGFSVLLNLGKLRRHFNAFSGYRSQETYICSGYIFSAILHGFNPTYIAIAVDAQVNGKFRADDELRRRVGGFKLTDMHEHEIIMPFDPFVRIAWRPSYELPANFYTVVFNY